MPRCIILCMSPAAKPRKKTMGAPTGSRDLNVAETRDRILRAAIEQFAQHGFAGARVDAICAAAEVNQRMVYHYFVDKAGLYLAALEHVLVQLRAEELKLKFNALADDPLDGLMRMFAFTFNHFAKHPELIRMLSSENLMEAKFLKGSVATPVVASPMLNQIAALIKAGEASSAIRSGIDPLHLYVMMVGCAYFHKSNAFTLAHIFDAPLHTSKWQKSHYELAQDVLLNYLKPLPAPRERA